MQLLQRSPQVLIVCGIDGIHTCKHHGLHLLESLDGLVTGIGHLGNGIAHLHLLRVLDTADDIAHVARAQFLPWNHVHLQYTDLVGIIFHTCIEELHQITCTDHTVHDLKVGDDTTERVEHRVEDQRLQRSLLVALGMRDALHDGIQDILYPLARLS